MADDKKKIQVQVRRQCNDKTCPATPTVGRHTAGTKVTKGDGTKKDCER